MNEQDTYRIVSGDDRADFVKRVNAMMAEGWTPQGGIAVRDTTDDDEDAARWFYQAMTRPRPAAPADPFEPNAEEIALARSGEKIEAIRAHRIRTGLGLVESKRAIELVMIREDAR